MNSFTAPITVVPLNDGKTWVLVSDNFAYTAADGTHIAVPMWFKTDFASIPQALWSLMGGVWGRHGHAAVLHDWGYYVQHDTRRAYDDIFREAMAALGVGRLKRNLMWLAVRGPGWFAWRANARKRQSLGPLWKMHNPSTSPPYFERPGADRSSTSTGLATLGDFERPGA